MPLPPVFTLFFQVLPRLVPADKYWSPVPRPALECSKLSGETTMPVPVNCLWNDVSTDQEVLAAVQRSRLIEFFVTNVPKSATSGVEELLAQDQMSIPAQR